MYPKSSSSFRLYVSFVDEERKKTLSAVDGMACRTWHPIFISVVVVDNVRRTYVYVLKSICNIVISIITMPMYLASQDLHSRSSY